MNTLLLTALLLGCANRDDGSQTTPTGGDGGATTTDTSDGAASDGGTADGGTADGGTSDGGTSADACKLAADPWEIADVDDLMAARTATTAVANSMHQGWAQDIVARLSDIAAARGVAVTELDCPVVTLEPVLDIEAGAGCTLPEGVTVEGRLQHDETTAIEWAYEDFVWDEDGLSARTWRLEVDGVVWMDSAVGAIEGRIDVSSTATGVSEWWYEQDHHFDLEYDADDHGSWGSGKVELVLPIDDSATGGFCFEYVGSLADDCPPELDASWQVEGDVVGTLTWDGSTACDGCADVTIDGVAADPYCD